MGWDSCPPYPGPRAHLIFSYAIREAPTEEKRERLNSRRRRFELSSTEIKVAAARDSLEKHRARNCGDLNAPTDGRCKVKSIVNFIVSLQNCLLTAIHLAAEIKRIISGSRAQLSPSIGVTWLHNFTILACLPPAAVSRC